MGVSSESFYLLPLSHDQWNREREREREREDFTTLNQNIGVTTHRPTLAGGEKEIDIPLVHSPGEGRKKFVNVVFMNGRTPRGVGWIDSGLEIRPMRYPDVR